MKKGLICFSIFVIFCFFLACNQSISKTKGTVTVTKLISDHSFQQTDENKQSTEQPTSIARPTKFFTNTKAPANILKQTQSTPDLQTPTITWTPNATLPRMQAQAYALRMMKTNGGCKLPCWLGITPGKTTWSEANAFLATFANSISEPVQRKKSYTVKFSFPDTSYRGVLEDSANIYVKTGGSIDMIMTSMGLSLQELLVSYGPPSEVRLRAIGFSTTAPVGSFTLVLFYKDQGIMAVYDGDNEINKIIHICPNHIKGPQDVWLLWDPMDQLTFSDAGHETLLISPVPPPSENDFIPIEKLTNLDSESFYERYKDPKNQDVCIEMQASDWP